VVVRSTRRREIPGV